KLTTTSRIGTAHFTKKIASSGTSITISSVVWSPDGQSIGIADTSGKVHLWNIDTKVDRTYNFSGITGLAWAPNGLWIASSSSDRSVKVWDATTGNIEFTYGGHFASVLAVAWSLDGKHIASGDGEGMVHVWDVSTGYTVFNYRAAQKK